MRSGHPSPAGVPDVDVVRSRLASSPTWSLPDRFGHSCRWRLYRWSVLAGRLIAYSHGGPFKRLVSWAAAQVVGAVVLVG